MIPGADYNRNNCPDPETVAGFMEGKLSEAERALIFDHLYECTACQEEFAVLRAVSAEQEEEGLSAAPQELSLRARELLEHVGKGNYTLLGEIIVSFSEQAIESLLTNISVLAGPGYSPGYAMRSGKSENNKKTCAIVAEKEWRQGNIRISVSREEGIGNSVSVQVLPQKKNNPLGTSCRISLCDKSDDVLESYKVFADAARFEGILSGTYFIKINKSDADPAYLYLELDRQT